MVPPSDMSFLPSHVEAPLGASLSLPLQVRGNIAEEGEERVLEPFLDCRKMSLSIVSSDSSIFNVSLDTSAGTHRYMYTICVHVCTCSVYTRMLCEKEDSCAPWAVCAKLNSVQYSIKSQNSSTGHSMYTVSHTCLTVSTL